LEPGKKLTDLIQAKFDHLGKRYERIGHCDVVLRKEPGDMLKNYFVEAKMTLPGAILFSSDRNTTFKTALDKVIHDLEHQLRHFKEVLEERR
jgi:ribosomal subunit interface protein